MEQALEDVWQFMPLKQAAKCLNIPYATLQNRKIENVEPSKARKQDSSGSSKVFSIEQEIGLKQEIVKLSQFGYVSKRNNIGRAGFSFAKSNKIKLNFLRRIQCWEKIGLMGFSQGILIWHIVSPGLILSSL